MNFQPEKKYGIPSRNFMKKNVLCEIGDEITRFDGILLWIWYGYHKTRTPLLSLNLLKKVQYIHPQKVIGGKSLHTEIKVKNTIFCQFFIHNFFASNSEFFDTRIAVWKIFYYIITFYKIWMQAPTKWLKKQKTFLINVS